MPDPIPGALDDWIEIEPTRWAVPDHPEYGVIGVNPPLTFEQYYASRMQPEPDRAGYDAMLDRRMDAALAKGDTDAAFQILLQRTQE